MRRFAQARNASRPTVPNPAPTCSGTGARFGRPRPANAALGVGKALAESLVRYLAPELAPRGVRVNAVARAWRRPPRWRPCWAARRRPSRLYERAARTNPSGRMSNDDDDAVVEFLLGPGAEFIQGQVIHADGRAYVG